MSEGLMENGELTVKNGESAWREVRLGDNNIDLISGFAFKSKNFLDNQEEGSLPVIKIKNVANGDVNLEKVVYHKFDESLDRFNLSKGDVLIAMTGNHPQAMTQVVGSVSMYKLGTEALLNQRVGKIVVKNDNSINFFYYFFKDKETHRYLASNSSGSANQANISKNDILSLMAEIPESTEQKAIAEVLSALDDKIDLLHRQNKNLEQMAETLFRQWFVVEAGEDWVEGVLPDEFDFLMGQSPKGSSFNEKKIGMPMFQGNADFGFRFPSERVYTTEPKRLARSLDTLISVRAPVGAQNIAEKECCIGRGVAAFRYKKNHDFYTYTYFKLESLMEEIKKFNDEGTVFGSISKGDFQKMEIVIPPDDLVKKFETEVKPINDRVIKNCGQIRTLQSLRDTLLPKLMSGEVRIASNG